MSSAESDFLAAGIRLFPDAHAAVEQFRRLVRDRVDAVLRGFKTDAWTVPSGTNFKTSRDSGDGIWCGAFGTLLLSTPQPTSAVIEVGLWWNAPSLPADPVVLCAYFDEGPSAILKKLTVREANGVEELRLGTTTHAIARPSADGTALDADLCRVIEALAAAVLACPEA